MSRTIKESLANRLKCQAKEAEVQGLNKVASNLNHIVENQSVRADDDTYFYEENQVVADAEKSLWNAVIRYADYYNCNVDASEMQPVIEKLAAVLMREVRFKGGAAHGVSPYEPGVPGQVKEMISVELDDE